MKIGSLAKIVVMLLSISMLGCLPVSSNVVVGHVESAEYTATLSKKKQWRDEQRIDSCQRAGKRRPRRLHAWIDCAWGHWDKR